MFINLSKASLKLKKQAAALLFEASKSITLESWPTIESAENEAAECCNPEFIACGYIEADELLGWIGLSLHEFHFKIDKEMKEQLTGIHLSESPRSLSGLIVRILSMLGPRLEVKHLAGVQMESRYEFVHEDSEMERESVHVYLPKGDYRQLKLMHQDLNFYSIAQLLRDVLRFFLKLVEKYGERTLIILKSNLDKWRKKGNKNKFSINLVRQLLDSYNQKLQNSRLLTLYNDDFSPIQIFRL